MRSSAARRPADSRPVKGDGEAAGPGAQDGDGEGQTTGRPLLQPVVGPVEGKEPPPPITLHREFKGLTVADLLQPDVAERLPGRARSALQHLQRGDLAAAEAALPGQWAPVLAGPGHRRNHRRLLGWLVAAAVASAALAAAQWLS